MLLQFRFFPGFPSRGSQVPFSGSLMPNRERRLTAFHEVLADYFPNIKQSLVLDLPSVPAGFDPHWTHAELTLEAVKSQP